MSLASPSSPATDAWVLRTKLGDERFTDATAHGSEMPGHVLGSFVLDTIKLALRHEH